MRKKILTARLLLVGTLAMLLTSCLGDGEDSISSTGEFMYVMEYNGKKYAAFYAGFLDDSQLDRYSAGDCFQASYKVNINSGNAGGYGFRPSYLLVDPANVYPKANQFTAWRSTEYPSTDTTRNDAFYYISMAFSKPTEHWGDRWLFEYSCDMLEEEKEENSTSIEIYYNPENQTDHNGIDVSKEKGICILDVVLKRNGGTAGGTSSVSTAKKVVDFSRLRKELEPLAYNEPNSIYKELRFRFRYLLVDKNGKSYKLITQIPVYGLSWVIPDDN